MLLWLLLQWRRQLLLLLWWLLLLLLHLLLQLLLLLLLRLLLLLLLLLLLRRAAGWHYGHVSECRIMAGCRLLAVDALLHIRRVCSLCWRMKLVASRLRCYLLLQLCYLLL
jgi:hypothetical protein